MDKKKLTNSLKVASALTAFVSFCIYFIVASRTWPNVPEVIVNHFLRDGYFISICLIFLAVGIEEVNRLMKFMFYYSISFFFGFMFFVYILNDVSDILTDVNKLFLSAILTTLTCTVYSLSKLLRLSRR